MKKINFDIIFKITVLLLLTTILLLEIISSIPTITDNNSNQNGRYKEVKVRQGRRNEQVYILDTQTGRYVN